MRFVALAVATLVLGACSWGIKLDSGGRDVRVAWNDDVSHCRPAGSINVSVLDNVGPYRRSGLKVGDELEVMARNQAASLGADTIKAVNKPHDGAQDWAAFVCGNRPATGTRRDQAPADEVQTYPLKEH
ncbi:MAG: DUF4156 domain-containing protein [Dokdonella sp.]|jgi:hypothetical protein|uniref:DUF4156 domain-containing protein n=1 Tax=Dokdonella sp. TaxID=2291710 RepID=UPI001B44EABA|nr:DUF4156 domain-containing protein [Dokdonella sp.]MBP6329701.1 DUF4156 domain-containing protein [Dokdonella sp.]HQV50586.1 DUF4156 domain-containing protein [Dokdonella sp.]HQW77773.1 DUF4156 domain-containing protein [Dokdonella sp.]HQX34226.1 DUF4156 domain-containing protein [Dokdonella sp.]